jgi:hypothetical protein
MFRAVLVTFCVALASCGSATSQPIDHTPSAAAAGSGIRGRVVIGPTCPVQRPGQRCVRGYRATIEVFTAARHRRVKSFSSGRDGYFRVGLAAGRYTLQAANPGLPHLPPAHVRVRKHRFTYVTLRFDSGIR